MTVKVEAASSTVESTEAETEEAKAESEEREEAETEAESTGAAPNTPTSASSSLGKFPPAEEGGKSKSLIQYKGRGDYTSIHITLRGQTKPQPVYTGCNEPVLWNCILNMDT